MLIACAWGPQHAAAQSASSTFRVGAGVLQSCLVLASSLSFGNYSPGVQATVPLDATGSVSIGCSVSSVQVTLGEGLDPDPSSTPIDPLRRMSVAGNYLNYNLYEDAARTIVWKDTLPGMLVSGPFPLAVPIYGRVDAGQGPPLGVYSDTILVTVNF